MQEPRPDLSALVKRPETLSRSRLRRSAWLLPAALFGGFALLFLVLFRDQWLPARKVHVTPAIAIEAKTTATENPETSAKSEPATTAGELLFQASGWIEPDPLPIKATSLTDGVVDEVHVLEGALVKKGDPLATLIQIDSQLARDAAASELDALKAGFQAQTQDVEIARRRLEAEQAGMLSDDADLAEAKDRVERVERIADQALPEVERISAQLNYDRKQAALTARKARIGEIEHEIQRIIHQSAALKAGLRSAEIRLSQAELAHQRTRITSPVDGRVLRLLAAPGQKKMAAMDDVDSSTIAVLYQPESLQVRVDVPLADAAALGVGQRARIRCSLLPDQAFDGEVTRISGEADIQRNSLQAKVRILNPTDQLRPEMLCRVEFLDTVRKAPGKKTAGGSLAIHVPDSAVRDGNVWVCDPESHQVGRRAITPEGESRDGYQRVSSGVRPGEWVILNPEGLQPGQRVKPELQTHSKNP